MSFSTPTLPTPTASMPSAASATPGGVPTARASWFAGLDGLRAIAVITVMLFHMTPGFVVGGYVGVDLFFVISGFLITSLLLREHAKSGGIRLVAFWQRRARRLLPALGLVLLTCCGAAAVIGGDVLLGLGRQVLGAITFSSNWLAIAAGDSYFDETAPELLRNLWSLAVEEQFYVLWPLAVLALIMVRMRWARIAIVVAVAVGSAVAMAALFVPGSDPTRVYYGTDTHAFGLALGAALGFATANREAVSAAWGSAAKLVLQLAGAVSIVGVIVIASVMREDDEFVYRGGLVVVAVLTTAAIAAAIQPGSWLGRILDVRPLRWIGERSYGLYLWHWPVFVLVVAALGDWNREGATGWALGGIALVITVVCAAASYQWLEQPIRKQGFVETLRRVIPGVIEPGWRAVAAGIAIVLVSVGGVSSVVAVASDPGKSEAQLQIEAGIAALKVLTPPPADAAPKQSEPRELVVATGDQITAIGDSVMLASATGLYEALPGIDIDAAVSRQLSTVPDIVAAKLYEGSLREVIVIGLGTNGPINVAYLDQVRDIAGPDRQVVLISVYAPRWWIPEVNQSLSLYALRHRDVELAHWYTAIVDQTNLLARDHVHPGPAGGRLYAAAVQDALQRLAELPPMLNPNDYGLAPHPA
ncbi:MAG TPA: acyltransferase family protein [Terrimesophilobacter sp.]|nr:acyltransferase family protein [Terrimesophilobacter sp.]